MDNFETISETDDYLIINKPANLSFHDDSNRQGLFNRVKEINGGVLWPVHRLDKLTSGLLILAKNQASAANLGRLFEQKQISKTYLAISDNKPDKKQGKIIGDMKKSRNGSWKLCRNMQNPAITRFKSHSLLPGKRIFWVTPETGKTHQIRVALKSLGAPILGDIRYKGTPADRGYLHAYKLSFTWQDRVVTYSCLPKEGEYFLDPALKSSISHFESS